VPWTNSMRVTIIMPVYNNTRDLPECLSAVKAAAKKHDSEIIVVDDASTDDTPAVAASMGVRVLRLEKNSGPGAARNFGARHATGDILFFVDADVVLAPDALDRVVNVLGSRPELAAVFGSYDARPRAQGLVSQYRNLLHHFVHQHGNLEASTFWAGCGAIRREIFLAAGGFDAAQFPRPSIEDIELGFRLRRAGHRILLDRDIQGTHLKRWKLRGVIWTDIACRAIPWSRLILDTRETPNDLNVKLGQRVSGALVALAAVTLPLALWRVGLLVVPLVALVTVVVLNRDLFAFFGRQRGVAFAIACIPMHLLYFLYSVLSYLFVRAETQIRGMRSRVTRSGDAG
jgi:glycosyltransferase involved in cell wall biosynthesis